MIVAGAYLAIKLSPLLSFHAALSSLLFLLGLATALYAGFSACFANDLKKIIALSTCSHIALVLTSITLSLPSLSLLHILLHASAKAALFMAAGYLIHLTADAQDLRLLGGSNLLAALPLASSLLIIATASLAGLPGLATALSKDALLYGAFSLHAASSSAALFSSLKLFLLSCSYALSAAYSFFLLHSLLCSTSVIALPRLALLPSALTPPLMLMLLAPLIALLLNALTALLLPELFLSLPWLSPASLYCYGAHAANLWLSLLVSPSLLLLPLLLLLLVPLLCLCLLLPLRAYLTALLSSAVSSSITASLLRAAASRLH